ncbi:UNVERIFIED_CONTAM: hypothetical protein FKN15_031784 [Acipenser sinensis]
MNLDSDCSMSVSCGNGKLRQWLIEQIDSGKYPGLVWESDDKTIFRIPWKHAGKQDYNRDEDAALFKVSNYVVPHERNWREYEQPHSEMPYSPCPYPARSHPWQGAACENGNR